MKNQDDDITIFEKHSEINGFGKRVVNIFFVSGWIFLTVLTFYTGYGMLNFGNDHRDSKIKMASFSDSIVTGLSGGKQAGLSKPVVREEIVTRKAIPAPLEADIPLPKIQEPELHEPLVIEGNANETNPLNSGELVSSTWFSDYEVMKKNVHLYNEIHPFIYGMQGKEVNNGKLWSVWGERKIHERVAELRMLNPSVKIIPTIFRWENKKQKISENIGMNGRDDIRDRHIQVILGEIEKFGYDGIDIDYEGMSCSKKEKFEEFIVLLSGELKSRNKILSVSIHPKTASKKSRTIACKGLKKRVAVDYNESWRGPMSHDYKFLAKYADKIKIMAYELHPRKYRNPGPGPQAPGKWISDIIEYAKTKIPPHKLYMAIPTYGYDWGLNCKAKIKAVYYSDAKRILGNSGSQVTQPTNMNQMISGAGDDWHNLKQFKYIHSGKTYEDPSIWYKSGDCDRVAFFMNKKAFVEKMNLLRKHKLAGFSFWQLTADNDPEINDYLHKLVNNQLPSLEEAENLAGKKIHSPEKVSLADSPDSENSQLKQAETGL